MNQPPPPTLLQKLLRRRVILPLATLLLLLGAGAFWLRSLFWVPAIDHPFDVQTFSTESIDDADNAYVDYQKAAWMLETSALDLHESRKLVMAQGWSAASDELRGYLEASRPALEVWRAGTEKSDALYLSPRTITDNSLIPLTQQLRTLVRLATLEAARLEAEDRLDEALAWYRAALRSSRHTGRRGCIIERLVGISMHAMTAEQLVAWSANPTVDAVLLRRAKGDLHQMAGFDLAGEFRRDVIVKRAANGHVDGDFGVLHKSIIARMFAGGHGVFDCYLKMAACSIQPW